MKFSDLTPELIAELSKTAFQSVPLHRLFDLAIIQVQPSLIIEMPLTDSVQGFAAPLHGGALSALIDVACNAAAGLSEQFDLQNSRLVTLDMHVRFLSQPKAGPVRAEARLQHERRRILQVGCSVSDAAGNSIAIADVACMVLRIEQDGSAG
jgi:uncharacterized protein (TIGR00369 family)